MTASKDQYWKDQFETLQLAPEVWALNAESLMRSFELVAQAAEADLAEIFSAAVAIQAGGVAPQHSGYKPNVSGNAILLGGLAVETLLKGIAVGQQQVQQAIQSHDKTITRQLWSHDVLAIATLAGVSLTPAEQETCKLLTTFIGWAGRYSTPKKHTEMMPRPVGTQGLAPPNVLSSMDFNRIRALYARLRALLPSF